MISFKKWNSAKKEKQIHVFGFIFTIVSHWGKEVKDPNMLSTKETRFKLLSTLLGKRGKK